MGRLYYVGTYRPTVGRVDTGDIVKPWCECRVRFDNIVNDGALPLYMPVMQDTLCLEDLPRLKYFKCRSLTHQTPY